MKAPSIADTILRLEKAATAEEKQKILLEYTSAILNQDNDLVEIKGDMRYHEWIHGRDVAWIRADGNWSEIHFKTPGSKVIRTDINLKHLVPLLQPFGVIRASKFHALQPKCIQRPSIKGHSVIMEDGCEIDVNFEEAQELIHQMI